MLHARQAVAVVVGHDVEEVDVLDDAVQVVLAVEGIGADRDAQLLAREVEPLRQSVHQPRESLGGLLRRELPIHVDAVQAIPGDRIHGGIGEGGRQGRIGRDRVVGVRAARIPAAQGQEDLYPRGVGPRHQIDQLVVVRYLAIASLHRGSGEGIADMGQGPILDPFRVARPGREIAHDLEIGGNPEAFAHRGYIGGLAGAGAQE